MSVFLIWFRSQQPALFGKVLFVLACLASTPFSRFQTLLYLDRGLTPAQLGTLQLTLPLKAAGYFVWGVLGDRIGMQKAIILCILMSTLAMEPMRWSVTFSDFRFVFAAKALRTSMNAAWPLVDGFAVKVRDFANVFCIRSHLQRRRG